MALFRKFTDIVKLSLLGALIGVFGGFAGGFFAVATDFVTEIRLSNQWLIFLLPVGGIVTLALYGFFRAQDSDGANNMMRRVENYRHISPVIAPLIFITSSITHLLGGSAGREGAAIQLGGSGASAFADIFHLENEKRAAIILSGMSAVFAAVFRTPFTAAVFILEYRINKKIFTLSALPCIVSAIVAEKISSLTGAEKETAVVDIPSLSGIADFGRIFALAVGISILSLVVCFIFDKAEHLSRKIKVNPYILSVSGSVIIILLTYLSGDMRYNCSGMNMALEAVDGNAQWYDFVLKIVFTAITLAAGFRGGEIVPVFCIGATFGCVTGGLLGIDSGLAAALGIAGLFCCTTFSPFSAVILSAEMFGIEILPYSIIVCLLTWLLSGKQGLFYGRLFKSPISGKIKRI